VRRFLVELAPPGERPLVQFHPKAEALFYADLDGREIRMSEPLFHEREPDWYLLRTSRWRAAASLERAIFERAGVRPDGGSFLIRRREETERWYAVPGRRAPPRAGTRKQAQRAARLSRAKSGWRGPPRAGTRKATKRGTPGDRRRGRGRRLRSSAA
jgi:hypothetical protein